MPRSGREVLNEGAQEMLRRGWSKVFTHTIFYAPRCMGEEYE